MQNWILWHTKKKFFNILSFFERYWLISLKKLTIWPQLNISQIFSIWISKNAEFDANPNRWKSIQKVYTKRKFECRELMYSVLKDEKVHNFYTFMIITFMYEFFTLFSIMCFLIHISKCFEKNICGVILALFTLNPNAHKRNKNLFFERESE